MAWVFEDKFNSDTKSTGDLNGQDGWSGGTAYDVVTDQKYEGDQAVKGVNTNQNIEVTFTAVASGVVYFAMRVGAMDASGDAATVFKVAASGNRFAIQFREDGGVFHTTITDGAGTQDVIASFSNDQWYVFEVTINNDDTHDIRYHDGSSWSTPLIGLDAQTGVTGDVDAIFFNSGLDQTVWWDTITPTNPVVESSFTPTVMVF